jgi:hypothetical protein
MKKTFQDLLVSVENGFPSIYTSYDVIKLLNSIKIEQTPAAIDVEKLLLSLKSGIEESISKIRADEVVDFSSAEFSINYDKQVELDDISFEPDRVIEVVFDACKTIIKDFLTNADASEEEPTAE